MLVQLCWHLMCDKGKESSEVHVVDRLNLVDDSSGVHVTSYSSVGAPEGAFPPDYHGVLTNIKLHKA